ncbi:MAG: primosomal protein [Microbacteriaceae bacterium]
MVDSSSSSGERGNRSERPQNARGSQRPPARGGKPAERGSWQKRDSAPGERGERKSYSRDGKPSERGERKPWENRDSKPGERKPWGNRDGKPGERSDRPDRGERKPYSRDGKPGERGERKPWENRDSKPGERKPWENRDSKPGERGGRPDRGERKPWENREGKPGAPRLRSGTDSSKPWLDKDGNPVRKRTGEQRPRRDGEFNRDDRPRRDDGDRPWRDRDDAPRHNDPELPDSVQARDLDKGAYVELKGLSKENAERVARHLVASALALEVDPELAHKHALAAARTAGRIAVVRETVAITAYETGDFALALRELRTFRRLSGKNTHIALIVDSERGLGRPERALEEGRAVDRATIPAESRVALAIAMSGARLDLNQPDLALGELEIPELDPNRAYTYSPMLFHAYAEVLDELGRAKDSAEWRHRAEVAQTAIDEEFGVNDLIEVYEEIDDAVEDVIDAAATHAEAETVEIVEPDEAE